MPNYFILIAFGVFLLLGFTVFLGAPYVPSKRRELERLFTEAYPLSSKDVLVDLGSGDGVVLRAASARGAKAVGYELGPVYVAVSRLLARGDTRQIVLMKNYWHVDFPADTTVVYAFSSSRDIKKMHELVQAQANKLGRMLTFITYGFEAPHKKPSQTYRAYYINRVTPCSQGKA